MVPKVRRVASDRARVMASAAAQKVEISEPELMEESVEVMVSGGNEVTASSKILTVEEIPELNSSLMGPGAGQKLAQFNMVAEAMKERKLEDLWAKAMSLLAPKFQSFSALLETGRAMLKRASTRRNLYGFPGGMSALDIAEEDSRGFLASKTSIGDLESDLKSWCGDVGVALDTLYNSYSQIWSGSTWKEMVYDLLLEMQDWFRGFVALGRKVLFLCEQERKVSLPVQCAGCRRFFDPAAGGGGVFTKCCGH